MAQSFSSLAKNEVYLKAVGHRRIPVDALGLKEVQYGYNSNPRRRVSGLRAVVPDNDQFQFLENIGEDPRANDSDYVFTPRRNTPRRYYERSPRQALAGGDTKRKEKAKGKTKPLSDADDLLMGAGAHGGVRTSVGGTPLYMKVSERAEAFQQEQTRVVQEQRKAEERRKRLGKRYEMKDKDGNALVYDDRGFLVTEEQYLKRKEMLNIKPPTPPKVKGPTASGRLEEPTNKYVEKMRRLAYLERKRKSVWLPGKLPSTTVSTHLDGSSDSSDSRVSVKERVASRFAGKKPRVLPEHLTRRWPDYNLLEDGDIMITIEHCCDCHEHEHITHHNEEMYQQNAEMVRTALSNSARQFAVRCFSELRPIDRVNPLVSSIQRSMSNNTGHKPGPRSTVAFNVDYASRMGAFEVQIAIKQAGKELSCHLLYSKLFHGRWPKVEVLQRMLVKTMEEADVYQFKAGVAVGVSGALTKEASLTPPTSPLRRSSSPPKLFGVSSKTKKKKLPHGLKHPSELPASSTPNRPSTADAKKKLEMKPDFDLRVQFPRSQRRRASDNIEDLFAYIGRGKVAPPPAAASALKDTKPILEQGEQRRAQGVSFSENDHILHPVAEEVEIAVPFGGAFARSHSTGTGIATGTATGTDTGTSTSDTGPSGQSLTTTVNMKEFKSQTNNQQKQQQQLHLVTEHPTQESEECEVEWQGQRLGSQSMDEFQLMHGARMEQRRHDYYIDSNASDMDTISPLTGVSPGPSPKVVSFAQTVKSSNTPQKRQPSRLRRAHSESTINTIESGAEDDQQQDEELPARSPLRKGTPQTFFADVQPDAITLENTQVNSGMEPGSRPQQPELVPTAARKGVLRKSYIEKLFKNIFFDIGTSGGGSAEGLDTITMPSIALTDVNPIAGLGFSHDSAAADSHGENVIPSNTKESFTITAEATAIGLSAPADTHSSAQVDSAVAGEQSPRPPPPNSTPQQSTEKLRKSPVRDVAAVAPSNHDFAVSNLKPAMDDHSTSPSVTSYSTAAATNADPDSRIFSQKAVDTKAVADRLAGEIAAAKAAAAAERARRRNEELLGGSKDPSDNEGGAKRTRSSSFSAVGSDPMPGVDEQIEKKSVTPDVLNVTNDGSETMQRRESVPKAHRVNSYSHSSSTARDESAKILQAIQAATSAVQDLALSGEQFVSHTATDIEQQPHKKKPKHKENPDSTKDGLDEYEDDPDHDHEEEGITSTSIPSTIAPDGNALSSEQGRAKMDQKMDKLKDMLEDDASLYNVSFNTKQSLGAELAAQYMKGDEASGGEQS